MIVLLASLLSPSALADDAGYQQLHAPQATASSYLRSNWNRFTENYHPTYILDGNPRTAWVEGEPGNGEGSWVQWPLSRVTGADKIKLRIRNGYHKSQQLLVANAAPRQVRLDVLSGGVVVLSQTADLKRDLTWQEVVLDPAQPLSADAVRMTVLAAYSGSAYADLCISDVETFVMGSGPYSGPVENAKKQAATAWIASRVRAAKAFANVPKTYPFASTQFDGEYEQIEATAGHPKITNEALKRAELAGLIQQGPWFRVDVKAKVQLPEGLDELDFARPWFSTDRGLFEAKEQWRSKKSGVDEWHTLAAITNVRVKLAADGQTPAKVAYTTRNIYEERSTFTTTDQVLIDFDDQGRPREIFVSNVNSGYEICDEYRGHSLFEIGRENDKINKITRHKFSRCAKYVEGLDPSDTMPPEVETTVWTPKG